MKKYASVKLLYNIKPNKYSKLLVQIAKKKYQKYQENIKNITEIRVFL